MTALTDHVSLAGHAAGLVVTPLAGRVGLRLAGEAHLYSVDALRRALAVLPPGAGEIHLQLAGLELVDVAATRELVRPTSRPARPQLVLHYPPPVMLRLLDLCWPQTRAQIIIATGRPARLRPA